jgi:predicted nucleotidyltransferase
VFDLEKLKAVFKDYPYVAAAYLFGSYATGKEGPMSDVDIAVLLKEPHPKGLQLIHAEDHLSYRIEKALGMGEVDLINMNRQGLIFQHNILRTGRLIYDGDTDFRIRFTAKIISDYCDFEPTLRFMNKFYFEGYRRRLARL